MKPSAVWSAFLQPSYAAEDFLCSDQYTALDNGVDVCFVKTDYFETQEPLLWRGRRHQPDLAKARVVLCGQSDAGLTSAVVRRYPHVRLWWSINNLTDSPRVQTLPLGLTNDTDESPLHRLYGNKQLLLEVLQREPRTPVTQEIQAWAYLNCNPATHPSRRAVQLLFQHQPWVTTETHQPTWTSRRQFLMQLRRHPFCICPRGNGLDTHRMWEALYMGCIPIVVDHPAWASFRSLPIWFVKDFTEVTLERLRTCYREFSQRPDWQLDRLRASYWKTWILLSATVTPPPPQYIGPPVVLVHLGPPLPRYLQDCVQQLQHSNPDSHIYLLHDQKGSSNMGWDAHVVTPWSVRSDLLSPVHQRFLQSHRSLNQQFRDGFFWLACRRLFVLYDFLWAWSCVAPGRVVFHIEYDNLIYGDLKYIARVLQDRGKGAVPLACPRLGRERMLANVLYVAELEALRRLLEFINSHACSNEMFYLSQFQEQYPSWLVTLPTERPGLALDGIFDAASVGQCVGGVDPRNQAGNSVGFVNEDSPWPDLQPSWVVWQPEPILQKPTQPYGLPLYNLHVHSKNLSAFVSTALRART